MGPQSQINEDNACSIPSVCTKIRQKWDNHNPLLQKYQKNTIYIHSYLWINHRQTPLKMSTHNGDLFLYQCENSWNNSRIFTDSLVSNFYLLFPIFPHFEFMHINPTKIRFLLSKRKKKSWERYLNIRRQKGELQRPTELDSCSDHRTKNQSLQTPKIRSRRWRRRSAGTIWNPRITIHPDVSFIQADQFEFRLSDMLIGKSNGERIHLLLLRLIRVGRDRIGEITGSYDLSPSPCPWGNLGENWSIPHRL